MPVFRENPEESSRGRRSAGTCPARRARCSPPGARWLRPGEPSHPAQRCSSRRSDSLSPSGNAAFSRKLSRTCGRSRTASTRLTRLPGGMCCRDLARNDAHAVRSAPGDAVASATATVPSPSLISRCQCTSCSSAVKAVVNRPLRQEESRRQQRQHRPRLGANRRRHRSSTTSRSAGLPGPSYPSPGGDKPGGTAEHPAPRRSLPGVTEHGWLGVCFVAWAPLRIACSGRVDRDAGQQRRHLDEDRWRAVAGGPCSRGHPRFPRAGRLHAARRLFAVVGGVLADLLDRVKLLVSVPAGLP